MRKIKFIGWLLFSTFISFEFGIIVLGVVVHRFVLSLEILLGDFFLDQELVKYLCFAPACILAYTIKCLNGVMSPEHSYRHVLTGWNERYMLKACVTVTIVYALLSAVAGLYIFARWGRSDHGLLSLALCVSLVVSLISAGSAYCAKHKLIELLDEVR